MIIPYYDGLVTGSFNHLPRCRAWIDHPFTHYALNYAHAGRIRWGEEESTLRTLTAPVAWWTVPGRQYVYGSLPGETWDHYYVTFDGPRAEKMWREGLIPGGDNRPHFAMIADADPFRQAVEALFAILDREPRGDPRAVYALEGLFVQIAQQTHAGISISPLDEAVRQWAEEIRGFPSNEWDAAEKARQMAVSDVHLRRVFRQIIGLPPHQFVIKTRLDTAARLLRTTAAPVKAIAAEVGVEDTAYFSRLFARRYGFPPATYRRETQLLPHRVDPEENQDAGITATSRNRTG